MKKLFSSFTLWALVAAASAIYAHQIGQDPKSIVLIWLNPVLRSLSRWDAAREWLNAGPQLPADTIMGSISVYWYIAHTATYLAAGVMADLLKRLVTKGKSGDTAKKAI